jgi:TRAP-type C4-dicarboxylate transport system permease small subunit
VITIPIVSLRRLSAQSALGKQVGARQGAVAGGHMVGPGGLVQALTELVFKFIRLLLGTGLLLSVLLICANAFGRYVLHAPIIWAEEVLGYVLVWLVYLGAVEVTRDDGHLSMDLVTQSLRPRWRRPIALVGNLVFLAVCALIIYQAIGSISHFSYYSQIAGLPMNALHTVIPVAFALMFLIVAVRSVRITFMGNADGKQKHPTEVPPV